jgi:hypothetical protein
MCVYELRMYVFSFHKSKQKNAFLFIFPCESHDKFVKFYQFKIIVMEKGRVVFILSHKCVLLIFD